MKNKNSALHVTAANVFLFLLSSAAAAAIGKLIVTQTLYTPISPEIAAISHVDGVRLLSSFARSSAIQMLIIFISGLTCLPQIIAAAVVFYRGICIGYTAAAISSGTLYFSDSSTLFGVQSYWFIIALYIISTVVIIFFSTIASSFSNYQRNKDEKHEMHPRAFLRYLGNFIILSGAVISVETVKCLLI